LNRKLPSDLSAFSCISTHNLSIWFPKDILLGSLNSN
jgi:hypothetical protein